MFALSNLNKTARAALAAVVIGSAAIGAAAPAQAASSGFGIWFGNNGSSVYMYGGDHNRGWGDRRWHRRHVCDRIGPRRGHHIVRRSGFHHIRLQRENRRHLRYRAIRHGWVYAVVVNRCSGNLDRVRPLHHRRW